MDGTAQVVVVASEGNVGEALPAGHDLPAVGFADTGPALAHVSELRARSAAAVLVLGPGVQDVTRVVMEVARRYPEVPVVVAAPPGTPLPASGRATARPPRSESLLAAARAALRAASQQARVRTTLDRLNVRLRTSLPADEGGQRRLVLSGLYLGAILEQAGDGIFVTDRLGTIALWNRAAGRLFGVDGAGGRRVDEAIGGAAGRDLLALVRGLTLAERSRSHALVLDTPRGPRHVEVSASLICDAHDSGMAVSCIARDVTRERELQRELELRAEALARSNRHKDEFLAVLSHELRTPLNAVLGWTHILATTDPDAAAAKRATEMIARNAERQRRLVEDLLDYARIAAGRLPLHLEPSDAAELVALAVAAIRPTIDGRGLRLHESYEPSLVVPLDRERFGQVITNLVSNAVKFTPSGGEVAVTARRIPEGIQVAVADTGQGIPEEFLPYIFDEFRQARESATGRESGLGLGLAIARRIVELHGGQIVASSDGPGRGATFAITLPG